MLARSSAVRSDVAAQRNFEQAVEILADVNCCVQTSMDEGRLRRELLANLDELRDDDDGLLHRFFGRELYGDAPCGRPVAGTEEARWRCRFLPPRLGTVITPCAATWWLGPPERFQGQQNRSSQRYFRRCRTDHAYAMNRFPRRARAQGRKVLIVDKPERSRRF
ncbi:MAG: hypothetical protein U0787_01615 [Polyangia bacterium]